MKLFLTGIAGFIGSNLANKLFQLGYDVYGVDTLQFGYPDNLLPGIKWDKKSFAEVPIHVLNSYDVLVHIACANIIYAQNNQVDTFKTNALDTIDLFQKFKSRIVYTSTSSVYGQADDIPTRENSEQKVCNAYDQSKLIAEKYLELRGNFTTLRLSNVYGPNQKPENKYCGVVARFIDNILTLKQPIEITGDPKATRDYTYIDDVVDAIISAINRPQKNCAINIGTGIETSNIELAHMILDQLGEKYDRNINHVHKRSIDNISRRCLDVSKANAFLGWQPTTSLHFGIEKTIQWMKNHYI